MTKISIDLLSELIVSVPTTDKCSSDETKRRTQLPWLQIRMWPSLYYLDGYLEPHRKIINIRFFNIMINSKNKFQFSTNWQNISCSILSQRRIKTKFAHFLKGFVSWVIYKLKERSSLKITTGLARYLGLVSFFHIFRKLVKC